MGYREKAGKSAFLSENFRPFRTERPPLGKFRGKIGIVSTRDLGRKSAAVRILSEICRGVCGKQNMQSYFF